MTAEEYQQLEENLLANGIREPISIWQDTIIDGHNRYEIAQKYGLEYQTKEYEFDDETDVIIWIIKNQLSRRNLHPLDRGILTRRLYKEQLTKKGKANQGTRTDLTSVRNLTNVDTKKELAKIAEMSHDTY